jgi:hypothetical protein
LFGVLFYLSILLFCSRQLNYTKNDILATKGVENMNPTLKEQLMEWKRKNQPKPKSNKKKQERVNWAEIMGMNRPRYKRAKGGAFRQR